MYTCIIFFNCHGGAPFAFSTFAFLSSHLWFLFSSSSSPVHKILFWCLLLGCGCLSHKLIFNFFPTLQQKNGHSNRGAAFLRRFCLCTAIFEQEKRASADEGDEDVEETGETTEEKEGAGAPQSAQSLFVLGFSFFTRFSALGVAFKKYSSLAHDNKASIEKIEEAKMTDPSVEWVATEKVHGANFSFSVDSSGEIECYKRTGLAKTSDFGGVWRQVRSCVVLRCCCSHL